MRVNCRRRDGKRRQKESEGSKVRKKPQTTAPARIMPRTLLQPSDPLPFRVSCDLIPSAVSFRFRAFIFFVSHSTFSWTSSLNARVNNTTLIIRKTNKKRALSLRFPSLPDSSSNYPICLPLYPSFVSSLFFYQKSVHRLFSFALLVPLRLPLK